MNFMMNAALNQVKDQSMALIPNEMKDKEEDKDSKVNVEGKGKENQIKKKPKKKNPITKSLAIKMYSILLFHTMVITILIFVFSYQKGFHIMKLIIFLACFAGGILLSFSVSKLKFLSKAFLNYIIYIILLAANIFGFVCCSLLSDNLSIIMKTMFIIFDTASISVIFFSGLVKDTPSTFWLMVAGVGGSLIPILVMAKIYGDGLLLKWLTLLSGAFALGVYESMTYNALDAYKRNNKNEGGIPSIVSLPFELNLCFVKVFVYIIKIISKLCSMCASCCCPSKKKK